jgi:hypothetical protein
MYSSPLSSSSSSISGSSSYNNNTLDEHNDIEKDAIDKGTI